MNPMALSAHAEWPCRLRLDRWHGPGMTTYVWRHDLDPAFPLAILEYRAPGSGDPMHWHDHLEIALVLDGGGRFRIGGRTLPAAPGDIFFIDDSQPHVALGEHDGGLRLLLVLFRSELIAGAGCRELDMGYLAPFRVDGRTSSPRLPGDTTLAREVAPVLTELWAIHERHDPSERQLMDATLRRVLALVNRGHATRSGTPPPRSGDAPRELIRPVLAYIDGHRREPVSLGDAAEVVHVSPSRIRHVFKDVTGIGFKEYVTHVRIAEAKRLLLTTDLSVAEVAHAVSYTNLHQFYKVFRRSSSMSPAEYRRYFTPAVAGMGPDGARQTSPSPARADGSQVSSSDSSSP